MGFVFFIAFFLTKIHQKISLKIKSRLNIPNYPLPPSYMHICLPTMSVPHNQSRRACCDDSSFDKLIIFGKWTLLALSVLGLLSLALTGVILKHQEHESARREKSLNRNKDHSQTSGRMWT